ncbi:MAG TPA: hypothetical protein VN948_05355 [Terriglobales bacterium]|nr:hypothetical protein [Terriglobales bacterium]
MVFTSSASIKLSLTLKCGFLKYIQKIRAGMRIALSNPGSVRGSFLLLTMLLGIGHASPQIVLAPSGGLSVRQLSGLCHGTFCAASFVIIICPRTSGVGFGAT